MDYHKEFFSRLTDSTGLIPWAGWIKHAFKEAEVNLAKIPTEEFNKIVLSMSGLIDGLVMCQKKKTYTKLLAQEMKKYFDDLREDN